MYTLCAAVEGSGAACFVRVRRKTSVFGRVKAKYLSYKAKRAAKKAPKWVQSTSDTPSSVTPGVTPPGGRAAPKDVDLDVALEDPGNPFAGRQRQEDEESVSEMDPELDPSWDVPGGAAEVRGAGWTRPWRDEPQRRVMAALHQ